MQRPWSRFPSVCLGLLIATVLGLLAQTSHAGTITHTQRYTAGQLIKGLVFSQGPVAVKLGLTAPPVVNDTTRVAADDIAIAADKDQVFGLRLTADLQSGDPRRVRSGLQRVAPLAAVDLINARASADVRRSRLNDMMRYLDEHPQASVQSIQQHLSLDAPGPQGLQFIASYFFTSFNFVTSVTVLYNYGAGALFIVLALAIVAILLIVPVQPGLATKANIELEKYIARAASGLRAS